METQTARGHPKVTDGYIVEKGYGRWQVEAGGAVVTEVAGYATALDIAKEHTTRPIWKVTSAGTELAA